MGTNAFCKIVKPARARWFTVRGGEFHVLAGPRLAKKIARGEPFAICEAIVDVRSRAWEGPAEVLWQMRRAQEHAMSLGYVVQPSDDVNRGGRFRHIRRPAAL